MLVHHRVTPSVKFAVTHLYTWVERGTVLEFSVLPRTQQSVPGQAMNPDHLLDDDEVINYVYCNNYNYVVS